MWMTLFPSGSEFSGFSVFLQFPIRELLPLAGEMALRLMPECTSIRILLIVRKLSCFHGFTVSRFHVFTLSRFHALTLSRSHALCMYE